MIIQKDNVRHSLLAIILIVLGATVSITGCGKKDVAKEEKQAAVDEKREAGHDGEHVKEEPDVVKLSPEQQKSSGIEVRKVALENLAVPLSATAAIETNM